MLYITLTLNELALAHSHPHSHQRLLLPLFFYRSSTWLQINFEVVSGGRKHCQMMNNTQINIYFLSLYFRWSFIDTRGLCLACEIALCCSQQATSHSCLVYLQPPVCLAPVHVIVFVNIFNISGNSLCYACVLWCNISAVWENKRLVVINALHVCLI